MRSIQFAALLILSACSSEHGSPNDPIALTDIPFETTSSSDLSQWLKSFALNNGLEFREEIGKDERSYLLEDDEIKIIAKVGNDRLIVTAIGAVTPASIELANRYIDEIVLGLTSR